MANKTEIIAEPGEQELFIIREFEAPRELLFRAHTDKDIYIQWVGPRELKMTIQEWDCREGGWFTYTHEHAGQSYRFFGAFHEVAEPERIVGTFEFDGLPERGHVILGVTTFEELPNGRSKLVHQSVFRSVEDRDGMVASGMERGVNDGYEKLDSLLAEGKVAAAAN